MKKLLYWLTLAGLCHMAAPAFATEVETLLTQVVPPLDTREALMLTVEYAPGEASSPHRHNAYTFVYILEGTVEMQVEGKETQVLRPGDTFFEGPGDVHSVSRNLSDTEPAKFVVFFIKVPDAPVSVPAASAPPTVQ